MHHITNLKFKNKIIKIVIKECVWTFGYNAEDI